MTTPLNVFRQGIFDIVVERGSAMQARCMDPILSSCAYRDGKVNACWVGLLLSDEEATNKDGMSHFGGVSTLLRDSLLPERYHAHVNLLEKLQLIHDEYTNWDNVRHPETGLDMFGYGAPRKDRIARALRRVAEDFDLNAKTVDEFYPA